MKQNYEGSRIAHEAEIKNIGGEDDDELEFIANLCARNEKSIFWICVRCKSELESDVEPAFCYCCRRLSKFERKIL